MRITIVAIGSRGDIQPFVALGRKLQAHGHRVTINTQRAFETFITDAQLGFYPMAGDPAQLMAMLGSDKFGANSIRFVQALGRWIQGFAEEAMEDIRQACWDTDMMITSFLGIPAVHIAEKRDIPFFICSMFPFLAPTHSYPSMKAPFQRSLGGFINMLSHRFERLALTIPFVSLSNRFREKIDLPPLGRFEFPYDAINGKPIHILLAYSPNFLPVPEDYPANVHVTGYWFLDAADQWTAPPNLEAFIEADEPPVYVGFGSMIDNHADEMSRIVIKALQLCGRRGLLLGGWGDLGHVTLNEDIFVIDAAPHDWLLPRMAAVVHHGGAGTVAAGLRAGKPSVIVPFMGDQPFWGNQIQARKLGPAPIPAAKISPEKLAAAIESALQDQTIRDEASKIGQQIAGEDGLSEALRIIETVADGW